jgi:hypothetical protein
MELLDNGATCNNSLANKRTLPSSDKHINHTIYTHDVSKATALFLTSGTKQ